MYPRTNVISSPRVARELKLNTAGHTERDMHCISHTHAAEKVLIYYRRILVGATHASAWEPRHVGSDSAESAL